MPKYGLADHELESCVNSLRGNKLLKGILEELLDTALTTWSATSFADVAVREAAWYEYKAVEKLQLAVDNAMAEIVPVTDPKDEK